MQRTDVEHPLIIAVSPPQAWGLSTREKPKWRKNNTAANKAARTKTKVAKAKTAACSKAKAAACKKAPSKPDNASKKITKWMITSRVAVKAKAPAKANKANVNNCSSEALRHVVRFCVCMRTFTGHNHDTALRSPLGSKPVGVLRTRLCAP
jgi:hypothetical protein